MICELCSSHEFLLPYALIFPISELEEQNIYGNRNFNDFNKLFGLN